MSVFLPCLIASCFVLFGCCLGGLIFPEEEMNRVWVWGPGEGVRNREKWKEGHYGLYWDVLYERKI